ncbi:MAG: acylneuraminate cytidylyltransferase family protein [Kiritimatiellaeota bacterium]|nr:acylneuraminate cytidylyltransferase family protein [Kiritimatiellota bacterium]
MRALGLIPARGGSKGIPGKNICPLLGRSLIERALASAQASGVLDRIVLSTDDAALAAEAQRVGLEVPFLRPTEFAADTSPMIDVAIHALRALGAGGYAPDVLVLLQPTAPLRTAGHIRRALELLGDHDSVCTVVPVPKDLCPHYVMKIRADGYLDYFMPDGPKYTRRQDVPQAWRRDGTLFVTRADVILRERSFYGARCVPYVLDHAESMNIDTPEDWAEAERRLARDATEGTAS